MLWSMGHTGNKINFSCYLKWFLMLFARKMHLNSSSVCGIIVHIINSMCKLLIHC